MIHSLQKGITFEDLAYRIFQLRQSELKNNLFLPEDVIGKSARTIQEIIANTEVVGEKLQLIRSYLIKLLSKFEPDLILDYCIREIENSNGLVTVTTLEKKRDTVADGYMRNLWRKSA